MAIALFNLALVEDYEERLDQMVAVASEGFALPCSEAILCGFWLAFAYRALGRHREALETADECIQRAGNGNLGLWEGIAFLARAYVLLDTDRQAAHEAFDLAIRTYEATGNLSGLVEAQRDQAWFHVIGGEPGDALRAMDRSLEAYLAPGLSSYLRTTLGMCCVLFDRQAAHEMVAALHLHTDALIASGRAVARRYDAALERARAELGDDRFARIAEQAASTSLAEAGAYARDCLRRLEFELEDAASAAQGDQLG